MLDFLGVRYVLVHVEKSPPALLRFVAETLPLELVEEWQGPDWTGAPSTIRLYRVTEAQQAAPRRIDLAGPLAPLYLGEGWSPLPAAGVRHAVRATPALLLDLPAAGSTVRLHRRGLQKLDHVAVNGVPVPMWNGAAEGEAALGVPAGVADAPGRSRGTAFRWRARTGRKRHHAAAGTGLAHRRHRRLPGAGSRLVARSAGEEAGDFAHIYLNGVDAAPNQRGYNLVALDAAGTLLDSAVFDTLGDPPGVGGAGGMAGAAGQPGRSWPAPRPTRRASTWGRTRWTRWQAGVAGDLRNRFRASHAFVGVVGAAPGSAVEAMSLLEPATVAVGSPVDAPRSMAPCRRSPSSRADFRSVAGKS